MKVAVYTCITENYDSLKTPNVINPKINYYCFNDGKSKVQHPWINISTDYNLSPKDTNRKIKIQPHNNELLKQYDLTIYVDGSIEILSDLGDLIEVVNKSDGHTFMYNHNYRNCIFEECRECYLSNKITLNSCVNMLDFLSRKGMSKNFGMYEAGVIIRKGSSQESIKLMNGWWENYYNSFGVKRDQIALMYTLWKTGLSVNALGVPDFYNSHLNFRLTNGHNVIILKRLFDWWVRRPLLIFFIKYKFIRLK